ncbi:Hypothetical protein AA314_07234 [Archangium gephyra]|uniref:Uncharacterized protein n=1 Tax=Archangium gephyra TaxID=48 RepID=A0AAC8TGY7_9BACT|nr:Hypothetical protein AA314_07234 [Archangium gephyra]
MGEKFRGNPNDWGLEEEELMVRACARWGPWVGTTTSR